MPSSNRVKSHRDLQIRIQPDEKKNVKKDGGFKRKKWSGMGWSELVGMGREKRTWVNAKKKKRQKGNRGSAQRTRRASGGGRQGTWDQPVKQHLSTGGEGGTF